MTEITNTKPAIEKLRYHAVQSDRTRSPIYLSNKSEDSELNAQERQSLISQSRDFLRNFSVVGAMIRSHLQFCSFYRFNAGTCNTDFNRKLENRIKRWSRRSECDASNRHGFETLLYLIELHRAIDGDVGIIRLANNKIQIVEGDRIRNSAETFDNAEEWVHGVRVNDYGRAISYDINKRKRYGGWEHERFISASKMDLLGYYQRADQIRGVSLLAPAARMVAQLTDSLDLQLARQRLEAALGLVVNMDQPGALIEDDSTEQRADEFHKSAIDHFGPGIFSWVGSIGESIQFITSNNPSQNFIAFTEMVIRAIYASFDIPYTFFDASKSTYYGNEIAVELYLDSLEKKQAPTIEMLCEWVFDWLLPNWLINGEIELPRGWTIDDLRNDVGWSGASMPSFQMLRNVKEYVLAIQSGLLPVGDVTGSFGFDIRKNVDELAEIKRYAQEKEIVLPFGDETKQNIGL